MVHTVPLRRRGAALEDAILDAAWDELAEVGYTAFAVEAVAARARTGKASIYRRWPTKQELVLDTLVARLPGADECNSGIVLADDTSTVDALHQVGRQIVRVMSSPAGDAMRSIKCEAVTDPELARLVDERFQAPRRAFLLDLLRRGVEREEVRPEAVTQVVADVVPAMIAQRIILQREPVTEEELHSIIEQVFIPLVSVR